ncbi:choice-of-anchor M domain-containing protein [Arcanobacterium phocae]|uniref:choice-of-anchor M domain-containing protein n=1 Tax=Arcanobacterium phocae TaxID=131112 RepID=UPI001C0EA562|nr:choice-of-anchor M domain-containing protein [Arcanobacterium phocae]
MKFRKMKALTTAVVGALALTALSPTAYADSATTTFQDYATLALTTTEANGVKAEIRTTNITADPDQSELFISRTTHPEDTRVPSETIGTELGETVERTDIWKSTELGWSVSDETAKEDDSHSATLFFKQKAGDGKVALLLDETEDDKYLPALKNEVGESRFTLDDSYGFTFEDLSDTIWLTTKPGTYKIDVTGYIGEVKTESTAIKPFTITLRTGTPAPKVDEPEATPGQDSSDKNDQENEALLFRNGHLDMFYVNTNKDGSLNLQMKEDITGRSVLRPADSAILVMGRDWFTEKLKWTNLPAELKHGYISPNTGARKMLYPGWASNDYSKAGYSDLALQFTDIQAPENGSVAAFHSAIEPGIATSDLKDGSFILRPGSEIELEPLGHKHFTWLFTEPGQYKMMVKVVGKKDGQPFESRIATYTWYAQRDENDQPKDNVAPAPAPGNDSESAGETSPDNSNESAPSEDGLVTLDHGHIDLFNVSNKEGSLVLEAKEDITGSGILRKAESFVLRVQDQTLMDIPTKLQGSLPKNGYFLAESGENQSKVLFPGWDTMGVAPAFNDIDIEFVDVQGPGNVFLFRNGELGGGIQPALTSNELKLTAGSVIHQPFPAHTHANWLFEKPGKYTMTVRASGKPETGGEKVVSNTATYTWIVGTEEKKQEVPNNTESTKTEDDSNVSNSSANGGINTLQDPAANRGAIKTPPVAKCFPKEIGGNGAKTVLPRVKDDRTAPATWLDPTTVQFAIGNAGKSTIPVQVGNVPAGSSVWMISSSQIHGVPWLGLNTQHPSLSANKVTKTTFSLSSFSGPGAMEVFTSGNFGALGQKWFSAQGGSGHGTVTLNTGTHVHPNWVFTQPGHYTVGLTMTSTTASGQTFTGNTTLNINVGSGSGITDGHFDLGPTIGAAGSKTVWLDANGKPCTPDANDLAAAGLATTGTEGTLPVSLISLMLVLSGIGAVTYRRKYSAR